MIKLFVTSLLLLSCSAFLFSQNSQETMNQFFKAFQEQNFKEAIETGNKFLNESAKKDTSYLKVIRYMAFSYYNTQDYPLAVEKYKEAQKLTAELLGKENYDYIMTTYNLAINYTYIGKYSMAFPLMKEVMDFIEKDQTKNSMDYINTGIQQANIYNIAGSYEKAAEIYDDVFNIVKNNYKESDSLYMQTANIVAPFYLQNGKYDKAEPFYTNAVKLMETTSGKLSKNYILTLNSLGEFYLYAGMYSKMETVFTESVDLCLQFFGKNSADYATSLNNLAVAYEKQGKNKQAEDLYIQCLKIKEKVYTKESDFYALTLSNFAVLYDNMGRYEESENLLNEAIEIYRKVYGETNVNFPVALSNMASTYSASGKYKNALELLNEAAKIQKKQYGEKYSAYINTLNSTAVIYEQMGKYDIADSLYEKTAQLRKEVLGSFHTDYATTLAGLAHIKILKGKYVEAEKLLNEALGIQLKAVGENHASYINCLNSLAGLYSLMGNYQLSEETYKICGQKYEKLYGDMHPEYATFLNNLGLFYYETGNYNQAEKILKRSLEIQENAFGTNHPDNVNMLSNLANVMIKKGDLKKAEELLKESLLINTEKLGTEHPNYVTSILGLGVFYYETGNYNKCEEYYLQALGKYKSLLGEKSDKYATTLNNLGTLYVARITLSDNEKQSSEWALKAEDYFIRAISIDSAISGTDNPEYASNLNNLAELYRNTGQFEKAEKLYLKTIEIERRVFGDINPSLAITYDNLGLLYSGADKMKEAEEYCLKSLTIKQNTFGTNNPVCSDVMASLAYIYEKTGKISEAEKYYTQSISLNYENIQNNFSFLSEEEKANFLTTINHYNDLFASFVIKHKETIPSATTTLYNNLLYNKGLLLRSSGKMKNAILNSNDKDLINKYNQWMGYRQQLAKLYTLPVDDRYQSTAEIEEKANSLEKELVSKSSDFIGEKNLLNVELNSVKNSLKENEAAIEFGHFKQLENNNTYSDHYYALVIQPKYKFPIAVELFEAADLQKAIGTYDDKKPITVSNLYSTDKLYKLIWEPLDTLLKGIKSLYFSPEGMLHKIAFASLKNSNNVYLSDIHDLNILSSTQQVVRKKGSEMLDKNMDISLFGGAIFSTDNKSTGGWKYLDGTKTEAEKIQAIFQNEKIPVKGYFGTDASEENLKLLDGKNASKILHIATHGFFYPAPEEINLTAEKENTLEAEVVFRGGSNTANHFMNSSNPLLRSGLALAHANDTSTQNSGKEEDGVLTAYEVSNLNFDNTQIVVLSACETGLGDIKGSEGVYGLQRAFKIAGVKYIIMSLWQVPDKETEEFMTTFYSKLLKTKNIKQAFSETQKEMRQKYDPYYWAAFVLIE